MTEVGHDRPLPWPVPDRDPAPVAARIRFGSRAGPISKGTPHMHHAPRPLRRTGLRSSAGLAAAALLVTGLTTIGTAADAAVPTTELGFEPNDLVAVGDAVFAVGSDTVWSEDGDEVESSHGYVARFGADGNPVGEPLDLGDGSTAVAAAPGGAAGTLIVVGSTQVSGEDEDSEPATVGAIWTVDADLQGQPEMETLTDQLNDVATRGTTSAIVGTSSDDGWVSTGQERISLGRVAPQVVAIGRNAVFAAGVTWDDDGQGIATAWEVTEDGAQPVALEEEHSWVSDLVVDVDSDVAYVASHAPNWYENSGITVLDGDDQTFVELETPATALALSADGETLYATTASDTVEAYATDALDSYDDDNPAPSSWFDDLEPDSILLGANGTVHLADSQGKRVATLTTPAAPANLTAAPDSMSTTGIYASWNEGKHSFELDEETPTDYVVTVRNAAGNLVATETTWDQVFSTDDLAAGQTYTVTVTAVDGAFASPVSTTTVTTHARFVQAPAAVTVQGSLTVGSQVSLNPGTWEPGTTLSYEWYGSTSEGGGAIGRGQTLALTAEHLGMTITGVVTGTHPDAAGVTLDARPGAVASATLPALPAGTPRISGTAQVGKTLTATAGSWPAGTALSYRWTADGKTVAGATGRTLKVTKALQGKRIAVQVTGTLAGHRATVAASAPSTKVAAAPTAKQKAKAKAKKAKQKAKAKAKKAKQKAKAKKKAKKSRRN